MKENAEILKGAGNNRKSMSCSGYNKESIAVDLTTFSGGI